ncbi:MAG: coenzyme F420-0:L-glutamate ligase [Chloroflexi bacterium]|nr:coenzyme F420-0:L-glutamate ligase [Chloroflexota bacterium]
MTPTDQQPGATPAPATTQQAQQAAPQFRVVGVIGMPEVRPGDDLASLITKAVERQGTPLLTNDVLVVTHKIVSKAEGRLVDLRNVTASVQAERFAKEFGKDARLVEVSLQESQRVIKMERGIIISQTRHGFICANAGVDVSNVDDPHMALLLPKDPDASARRLRKQLERGLGFRVAVVISDTFGRPWREGCTNIAIGVAGIRPLQDHRGHMDPQGRTLRVSVQATADELTGAAELVMGKLDRVPVAIIRGLPLEAGEGSARELVRDPSLDLFQ